MLIHDQHSKNRHTGSSVRGGNLFLVPHSLLPPLQGKDRWELEKLQHRQTDSMVASPELY